MPRRYTSPRRPPAGPPANAEEGAARVLAVLVKLFDRGDGTGADWRLMLESLYRTGFKLADDQLPDKARRALMRRVYEGAELRLTGGFADGSGDGAGPSKTEPDGVDSPLADIAGLKSSPPRTAH